MKILGIICEYNPLHLGHLRHITFSKKIYGDDGMVVCVMSGNFTQRGLPAVTDKYTRAKHAVLSGADAVIELPVIFSTGSATDFACGGVKILDSLDADGICCGSECGDGKTILDLSKKLVNPTLEFNAKIKEILAEGENYPTAVSRAERELFGSDLLSKPNNLLAVEYQKAIFVNKSDMSLFTLKRDSDYNDESADNVSSSSVRKAFYCDDLIKIKDNVPTYVFNDLSATDRATLKRYREFLPIFLSTMTKTDLSRIADVTEGLENLLSDNVTLNFDKYVEKIKTRRYTRAKLDRILLYCVLGIDKKMQTIRQTAKSIPINLLAIRDDEKVLKNLLPRIENANKKNEGNQEFITINDLTKKSDRFYNTIFNIVYDKTQINRVKKY